MVVEHLRNDLGEIVTLDDEPTFSKLSKGSVHYGQSDDEYLVEKIISETPTGFKGGDSPKFKYKIKAREIKRIETETKFADEETLYKAWPKFHPDFVYDWTRERGRFTVLGKSCFEWIKRDSVYSLDMEGIIIGEEITTDDQIIKACLADVVLVAEAIKHRAWKLLSRRGSKYIDDFFKDFPDSKIRYGQYNTN